MKAIDTILVMVPTLSEVDKERVRKALGMTFTPCERNGHSFKRLREVTTGILFWKQTTTIMHCSKCNEQVEL